MGEGFLRVALFLAYGPLVLMLALYLTAFALRCSGRGQLLQTLIVRTSAQEPIRRGDDSH